MREGTPIDPSQESPERRCSRGHGGGSIHKLRVRMRTDEDFVDLLQCEEDFPSDLPDSKSLYTDFYNKMTDLTTNTLSPCCGCLEHRKDRFNDIPIDHLMLRHLHVDPSLVPFSFASRFPLLDNLHLLVNPLGIITSSVLDTSPMLLICNTCKLGLHRDVRPKESLANYLWVGAVPPELQDQTWIEELLIAHAHLTGQIIRLQNRNTSSHFGLKGHIILLPQDTTELLDILPRSSSSLPDIVHVVWVGRLVRDTDALRNHFSVRTRKVCDALCDSSKTTRIIRT
jgi:hypothetical protein